MALVPFPGSKHAAVAPIDPDDEEQDLDGSGAKMSFLEHLDELRKRIIWSLVGLLVGFLISLVFQNQIFDFIMRPLAATLPAGGRMVYTEPTEGFMLHLKMAFLAGIVVAAPAVMWQVWLFVAPGLYRKEKRLALPFVLSSSLLFVAGAAFNHYVMFPAAFKFLGSFTTDYMTFMPRIAPVFSLYAQLMLAFGLIFQMPVIVFTLARIGILTAGFMWKNTKYAILLIFIVAAVITPTADPLNQTIMAAPMIVLYILSIGIAWAFGKKNAQPSRWTSDGDDQ